MTRARACGARRARSGGSSARSGVLAFFSVWDILSRSSSAGNRRRRRARERHAPDSLAPSCHRRAKTGLRVSRCVASRGRLAGAPLRASWRQNRTRFFKFLKRAHVADRYFGAGGRAARARTCDPNRTRRRSFLASGRSSGHIRGSPEGRSSPPATGQSSSNSRALALNGQQTLTSPARITARPLTLSFTFLSSFLHLRLSVPLAATRARPTGLRGAEAGDPRGRPLH